MFCGIGISEDSKWYKIDSGQSGESLELILGLANKGPSKIEVV